MKVWISVDMEGIAGAARVWMTEEVNAVVEGCFQGGATEVVVADGHGSCRNILRDRLDPRARVILDQFGSLPPTQVSGLHAGFDAAMLVGYHARARLSAGNLDHTAWSQTVTDVSVNDRPIGEAELVDAYAGALDVPTVLVSGDDVLGQEIETSMPDVLPVVVLRSLGRYQSELVAREEVHRRLRSGAERALRRASTVRRFAFPTPLRLRVTFTRPGSLTWPLGCPAHEGWSPLWSSTTATTTLAPSTPSR